jgi:hypothetical protein
MSLSSRLSWTFSRSHARRGQRRNSASRPKKARLFLEPLEDRALLSGYSALTVSDLIADINAANAAGGANTITLTAPTTSPYVLTAVNNAMDGATGLPRIATNNSLTIVGSSDSIERSTASGTAPFRLFDVAAGASLTLENLTLQGGSASGSQVSADGGAIYNQGILTLTGMTGRSNIAQGLGFVFPNGGVAACGGSIWSNGSVTLEDGTRLEDNLARGSAAGAGLYGPFPPAGAAYGGALYVAGGTAKITDTTFTFNRALAGSSEAPILGGGAYGGALYVAAGQVVLTTTTVNINSVVASGRSSGHGGGLFIASAATVELDAFTLANVIDNTAPLDPNVDGTYITI